MVQAAHEQHQDARYVWNQGRQEGLLRVARQPHLDRGRAAEQRVCPLGRTERQGGVRVQVGAVLCNCASPFHFAYRDRTGFDRQDPSRPVCVARLVALEPVLPAGCTRNDSPDVAGQGRSGRQQGSIAPCLRLWNAVLGWEPGQAPRRELDSVRKCRRRSMMPATNAAQQAGTHGHAMPVIQLRVSAIPRRHFRPRSGGRGIRKTGTSHHFDFQRSLTS
mmetsp:Transcript_1720/g.5980  ORF Transcript_1720/g.5980 Transcript_1720/m.5980 type:complete len:219 (+) Transcript_1720:761-1417(+)